MKRYLLSWMVCRRKVLEQLQDVNLNISPLHSDQRDCVSNRFSLKGKRYADYMFRYMRTCLRPHFSDRTTLSLIHNQDRSPLIQIPDWPNQSSFQLHSLDSST